MAAVGLATTGTVALAVSLAAPGVITSLVPFSFSNNQQVRRLGSLLLCLAVAAVGLALLAGWGMRKFVLIRRFSEGVWESAFAEKREGFARHVAVELKDGRTIEGRLGSYTLNPGSDGGQQLSLEAPIRVTTTGDTEPRDLGWERVVLAASDMSLIALQYVPASASTRAQRD